MEFEINDLEIIDTPIDHHQMANSVIASETSLHNSNSLILKELHKENEELQNKLKLNYRRLLLFETENTKLIEEKNKLFFETQNYIEQNRILSEKNNLLEKESAAAQTRQALLNDKIESLEKINKTQLSEIKRFTKFHDKIQQVVKPFIVDLKRQILMLKTELGQTQATHQNLMNTYKEHCAQTDLQLHQKTNEINSLNVEKNLMIQTYEEQIHSFSKEILDLQTQNDSAHKEVARLKKAVEFKNYFENEVIRFKRIHEEDQKSIAEMTQKKAALEASLISLEQNTSEMKQALVTSQSRLKDTENQLEVTRAQFAKKIDELNTATDRLGRLERLNIQLSQEISTKQS
ncbi:hypothetical protein [Pseudobdellovibrio exovorus]|uniref:Uncharacterized protein n=1 Tax=Pseudobdellovibrio exovorus JSS TaxID=1184267 RepID=M4VAK7_9BACT|nr:hypothetical protein [Pseudobdellovibrio exovorus]AGH95480.1 hypothetical protein A11Q_1264 [Pseudobdellovibrio exovorus JSS]